MAYNLKADRSAFTVIVALTGWLVPGAGYLIVKEKARAAIVFITLAVTFGIGIYVGSIGVIDPVNSKPWYFAQILNSPAVAMLGHLTAGGGYEVYGKPREVGQIYTSIAGLLNLLCVVNCAYLAYTQPAAKEGQ